MKISFWHYLALISVVVLTMSSSAVVADDGKISGLYFGDYYYIAAHHNEERKSRNGFWTRRVYLTYDQKLNETFSSRLRFEMNSPDGLKADAAGKNIPVCEGCVFESVTEGFVSTSIYSGTVYCTNLSQLLVKLLGLSSS